MNISAVATKALSGLVMGATVGGFVGAIRGFMSKAGYIEKLEPQPECFDLDVDAAKLFFDLAQYRYLSETSYVESMHNVDSLFCLEKQINLGEVEPQITDPPTATQYAIRALTHLRRIQTLATDDLQNSDISEKIKELEEILESHVSNIRLACKHI